MMKSINVKADNTQQSFGDLLCCYYQDLKSKNAKDKYFET